MKMKSYDFIGEPTSSGLGISAGHVLCFALRFEVNGGCVSTWTSFDAVRRLILLRWMV